MSSSPYSPHACSERIATTPEEANEIFSDAVTELNQRAASMTATGKRTWEPAHSNPALVIITDEHAELLGESHESMPTQPPAVVMRSRSS